MKKVVLVATMALVSFHLFGQKWTPVYEGSTVMYDAKYKYKDVEWKLNNESMIRVNNWNVY